ncbi:MAG TPA: BTAD domain-containing putative transcriptional regulator [Longimicrobiales bacterium]|nr:BTAD domain-containing putative transcriptional regulator [Longimicrobiales bacterium]
MTDRIELMGGFRVVRDGREVDRLKARPTCAALLAYLAAEGCVTRDEAVVLLWPESDDRRGRHALNQTVYQLRKILGPRWILSRGPELRLGQNITVDVREVRKALEAQEYERAAEIVGGRFLSGWHLRDTAGFEEWVDETNRRHVSLVRDACRARIGQVADDGHREAVLAAAKLWLATEPTREEPHLALMRSLLTLGRPQAAVESSEAYADRLARFGAVPGPEAVSLASEARSRIERQSRTAAVAGDGTPQHRLLVLPFAHLGPAEFGHLTQGLTDDITVWLSRHPGLGVIARPSALHVPREGQTLEEIGRALGVESVLSGCCRWTASGDPPRISVRHVRVADGRELWSRNVGEAERSDADVRAEVVTRTLEALGLPPSRSPHASNGTPPEASPAYELCIRGLQHWHRRSPGGLREAIDLFVRAVEADRSFARAYGCLALAYAMLPSFAGAACREWMPKARRCAAIGLKLDPDLVEGHLAAGSVAWAYELDAQQAGRHWGRALELEPSNAQGLAWEAYRRVVLGDHVEAERLARDALAVDPLSVSMNFDVGFIARCLGKSDRALERMRSVLIMDPSFSPAAFILGVEHLSRGEVDGARQAWARIDIFGPVWKTFLSSLHDPEHAAEVIDRLVYLLPGPVHWYAVAVLYVALGQPDRALEWLETHLRNLRGEPTEWVTGGPGALILVADPAFEPLRGHPRFRSILRAMGLPTAPRTSRGRDA